MAELSIHRNTGVHLPDLFFYREPQHRNILTIGALGTMKAIGPLGYWTIESIRGCFRRFLLLSKGCLKGQYGDGNMGTEAEQQVLLKNRQDSYSMAHEPLIA